MSKQVDIFEDIKKELTALEGYVIELGVFDANSGRTDKARIGVNNAELMYIHENGSPLQHIPARPVLQMTIDYAKTSLLPKAVDKATNAYLATENIKDFENELTKLCIQIEKYARKIIYSNDGRLAPNAPRTIARKGDNHPLFDTGQLARSITCQWSKK